MSPLVTQRKGFKKASLVFKSSIFRYTDFLLVRISFRRVSIKARLGESAEVVIVT